jgi:hypothetical protein
MKKIITKEESERKNQRNQLIVGGILILLMVLAVFGYALTVNENSSLSGSKKIKYKDITFIKNTDSLDYWQFQYQGYNFITKYNPNEVENISFFSYVTIMDYVNKPLYYVGNDGENNMEILRNLNSFVVRIGEACIDKNCSGDLPVKNCSIDNVIVIKELVGNEEERIYQEEKCTFIIARYENMARYEDAVLFKILGII